MLEKKQYTLYISMHIQFQKIKANIEFQKDDQLPGDDRDRQGWEKGSPTDMGKLLGVMDMLTILIYQVYECVNLVKIYTCVRTIVCQLYHDNTF